MVSGYFEAFIYIYCYIPDFWWIIVVRELVLELSGYVLYMDSIIICTTMWINVLICDYRLLMGLEHVVKLLAFVNGISQ